MQYFVVMIDYPACFDSKGRLRPKGREAIVDPELTRREVVSRIRSGEYDRINFIHEVRADGTWADVTDELIDEANAEMEAA